MSSSKIIKAGTEELLIGEFSFQNMHNKDFFRQAKAANVAEDFTPLELFDTSELGERSKFITQPLLVEVEDIPPPSPPGTFVSDDELQRYQEESYQRGLLDGKNLAERGLLHVFRGLRTAAEDLLLLREKALRESEDDLLSLSISVARKVIDREVSQDHSTIVRLIRAALQNLSHRDELTIRIHPDDHALLTMSQGDDLKKELSSIKFSLKPDPGLEVGSCLVETERGTVDAGFEAQLDEIYRHLLEECTDKRATAELEN